MTPINTRARSNRPRGRIVSAQAVQALAQQPLDYSDSQDDLQIKNAYTLKRDGTRLDVSPGAIIVRQKSGMKRHKF